MRKFFSSIFLTAGFLCFLTTGFLVWQRNDPGRLKFELDEVGAVEIGEKEVLPLFISIPGQKNELPIYLSSIRDSKWETTTRGVSLLSASAVPGETGNSIIYGHNWSNLLGSLANVGPGDEILIFYSNGDEKVFDVRFVQEVDPSNVSVLEETDDKRLTIYTCSGFLDRKRLVVTAFLREDQDGQI